MEVISCSLLLEHYWNRFLCCNWIRHLAAWTDVTYFLLFSIHYSSGGLVDFGDCRKETELTGHKEAGWRWLVKFLLYTLFKKKKKSLRNTLVLSAAFFLVLNHIRARLFKYFLLFIVAKWMTLSLDFLFGQITPALFCEWKVCECRSTTLQVGCEGPREKSLWSKIKV